MTGDRTYKSIDLSPYYPYGIPILKLLGGLVLISLAMVGIYEFVL
jgi:hypothetical protein